MAVSAAVQAVLDAVAAEKTQTASAIALLVQLNALIQNVQSPDDLAALKQTAADLTSDAATVQAAVLANTPPAPPATGASLGKPS